MAADHKVPTEEGEARNNHRYAVVIQDPATRWILSNLCKTRLHEKRKRAYQSFSSRLKSRKSFTLTVRLKNLSWNHNTSNTPSTQNERRLKEGTSAVLLQSGLDEKWWTDSMECCCYLRNVQDLLAEEKAPYERRFWESCKGPINPFGTMSEYHPSSPKDQARIHQFGLQILPGSFLVYELIARWGFGKEIYSDSRF